MSKVVIISDLHFGIRDLDFLEMQLNYFEKVVFPYIVENNITTVIQLGDTTHNRKYSLNQMISEISTRYFHWFNKNKVTLFTIVGNHDSPNRENAKFSPLYALKSKYIIPIKNNKLIEIDGVKIALHSYFCHDFLEADIGFFHHDFVGHLMNKTKLCEIGDQFPAHLNYKKVYSGHYHSASNPYLKTPFQLSFESFGDTNGFIVLDTETFEETFVENTLNQKFIKVYYYNKDNIVIKDRAETTHNIENVVDAIGENIVELNIENVDNKIIVDKLIQEIKHVEYKYNNYFINKDLTIENKESFVEGDFNNIEELYDGYIKTIENEFSNNIDKELLKNEFLEIYHECKIEE